MKKTNSLIDWIKFVLKNALICLGFFLLSQLPSFLSGITLVVYSQQLLPLDIVATLIWLIASFFITRYVYRYYKKNKTEESLKVSFKDVAIAFGYFLMGSVLTLVGNLSMSFFYDTMESENDLMIQTMLEKSPSNWFVLIMVVQLVILAPILEELAIRGIPKVTLFQKSPDWFMLVMTSLFFSSLHQSANIISFMIYAALGGLMCHAYLRRGRIIDSMLVHFFNNLVATIAFLSLL